MKHSVLFAALGLVAFGAAAQEIGTVISTTPVIQQVAVPRQTCQPGMVQAQPYTSGMGGLAGALIGGGIGSTIGHGSGTIAAAMLGTIGGALLGNSVEANNMRAQQAAVPNCFTENTIENRTVGYDVVYEYAGRQYSTRLPYDPGPTVRLQITPVSQGGTPPVTQISTAPVAQPGPAAAPAMAGVVSAPPVQGAANVQVVPAAPAPAPAATAAPQTVMPAPVVVQPYPAYPPAAYPAYPAYPYPYPVYRPYYYPPVSLSLGFVFGSHSHGRWR